MACAADFPAPSRSTAASTCPELLPRFGCAVTSAEGNPLKRLMMLGRPPISPLPGAPGRTPRPRAAGPTHAAGRAPTVDPAGVFGLLAKLPFRLGLHPVGPAVQIEIVDV